MTDQTEPNQQTAFLLGLLAPDGFVADPVRAEQLGVAVHEGFVEHPCGVWVHSTPEMVRLVAEENLRRPEHRLMLGRRNLTIVQALRAIAVYARAAVQERW
jgi:hypothetical protein